MAVTALEYKNYTFAYPDGRRPLAKVNWAVEQGAFAVLVGSTGSGKTTLLCAAKPELAPTGTSGGIIEICGQDCSKLDAAESARTIGYVSQNPDSQIVCDTVWHQMAFGLENLGVPQEEMRRRVAEVSHFLGIGTWFRNSVDTLSGGQRQLLALASVLVMRPQVMILDEPTSQLDPIAEKDFMHALFRLNRELGLTVVVATHTPEQFVGYATQYAMLRDCEVQTLQESDICEYAIPIPKQMLASFTQPIVSQEADAITCRDLYVRHNRNNPFVLRGLNLQVKRGSLHAIVGGNGSGKTTMLRAIAGLMKPERGKMVNSLQQRQAMLPQDPKALFVCDTVEEELREWQNACGYSDEAVADVLERYGLADHTQQHPYDLSGGQQQLLAFAKLELTDPDLLLMDEPTKGLDPQSRLLVANATVQLVRKGRTVVLVTHDLSFSSCIAMQVTMLFDGQATCTQSAREFFEGNLFYKPAQDSLTRAFASLRQEQ